MKNIILCLALAATTLAACSGNSNKSVESQNRSFHKQAISLMDNTTTSSTAHAKQKVSVKVIVDAYLQIKNAFTADNSTAAAAAGKKLETAFKNFDKSVLFAAQKKIYVDVETDAIEHAQHIGANGGKIVHQREHFVLLSKDMYDLVKAFGGGLVLYKDFDPMANNGKGAFWLSETKESKNPYMGKAMLTSGSMKEDIK